MIGFPPTFEPLELPANLCPCPDTLAKGWVAPSNRSGRSREPPILSQYSIALKSFLPRQFFYLRFHYPLPAHCYSFQCRCDKAVISTTPTTPQGSPVYILHISIIYYTFGGPLLAPTYGPAPKSYLPIYLTPTDEAKAERTPTLVHIL